MPDRRDGDGRHGHRGDGHNGWSARAVRPFALAARNDALHLYPRALPAGEGAKGKRPASGDGDICHYEIVNGAHRKVGHAGFACGLIGGEEGVCDGTMILPGGTLAIAGDLVDGHQIAIAGGTGRYLGATGEWSYGTTGLGVTVRLLLPRA